MDMDSMDNASNSTTAEAAAIGSDNEIGYKTKSKNGPPAP